MALNNLNTNNINTNNSNGGGSEKVYDRLSKTKIGNKRGELRRTRSKSLDHLPVIDMAVTAKISKQFEHLQDAYKASPPPLLVPSQPVNGERRRSLLRKTSKDDIIVGTLRPRSTMRPVTVESSRPHTQPSRVLHRGFSKDDNDIQADKPFFTSHAAPIQPAPPTGRRGSVTKVLKRGQSKDDNDLQNTTSHRSPRKVWVSGKNPSEGFIRATVDSPHLLMERPKLFWRQRISTLIYLYHHVLPQPQPQSQHQPSSPFHTISESSRSSSSSPPSAPLSPSSSSTNPDFSTSYFEIIPIDVEKKGYNFDRVYVSIATLIQMKSNEFNAIIESRPRSITTKPYASKEEIARVNKIKKEEKFKLLIETCADYCLENIEISQEDSNQEHIVLNLRKYHEEAHGLVVMNVPKPPTLVPVDLLSKSLRS